MTQGKISISEGCRKERKDSEQNMTQTITQQSTEATKVAITVVRQTETPLENARTAQPILRAYGSILKQPILNSTRPDMHHELITLKLKL